MEKIEKEIKVTRYAAFDGTEFETEAECQNYEGSAFGLLVQQLEKCTLKHFVTGPGQHGYCLVPRTRHDVFVLGQILKMAGNEEPCADLCDHLTLLNVSLECNTVASAEAANLEEYILKVSNGQYAVVSNIKDADKR